MSCTSTCVASNSWFSFEVMFAGVTPVAACVFTASESVRALMVLYVNKEWRRGLFIFAVGASCRVVVAEKRY